MARKIEMNRVRSRPRSSGKDEAQHGIRRREGEEVFSAYRGRDAESDRDRNRCDMATCGFAASCGLLSSSWDERSKRDGGRAKRIQDI